MKIEKRDGKRERDILSGMIVHNTVCGRLANKWEAEGLFKSPWCNLVGSWVVKYHKKYGKAPNKNIVGLFQSWAQSKKGDEDTVKLVEKFLGDLSGEYRSRRKAINPEYMIDVAGEHFNNVKIDKLSEALKGDLASGKSEDAIARLNKFSKVEVGAGLVYDPFHDSSLLDLTYARDTDSLVKFPGALGEFYGRALARGNFISYMGPMKRAKSFFLLDLGFRGAIQRKRVMFFQVGDLSLEELMERFVSRATFKPFDKSPVRRPISLANEDGKITVEHEDLGILPGITKIQAKKEFKRILKEKIKSDDSYIKLAVHPPRTLSMDSMRNIIDDQIRIGWMPDIIVIDYADILAHPSGFRGESRDAVNENWILMRKMCHELHVLTATATQTNASSFTAETLDMSMFSEDNRKFAHVTSMVGLGQTSEEKDNEIWRLNFVVLRKGKYSIRKCVSTAGCLALANPTMKSCW